MLATPVRADLQQLPQSTTAAKVDPVAATDRYLATVPPDKRARSDAYVEGGYWLDVWSFLLGAVVQWLFLQRGWSAGMRDRAARLVRARPLQTAAYWVQYLIVTSLLLFPLSVYAGFIREHQYGLATQTFAMWLGDQAKGLGVGLVLGGLAVVTLYGVLRRMARTWWLWGSMVMIGFTVVSLLIGPVFIAPLFNTYTPLQDPRVRDPILEMARAHGVGVSDVYQVDASRQTTRISANVSGFLGTERITLNDNLLRRGSPAEIKAVMGHELGHYVLNHMYEIVLFDAIVIVVGFGFLRWGFDRSLRRWGAGWGVRDIGDVAGLPLIALLFSIYSFALTPLQNTFARSNEYEADLFGLNAAREPDGFAEISLKLGEYRKLAPGPVEEWIFFDHPSGRTRILAAMRWKAHH
ncbi:MAG: M48 family metallopeptidase [Acidobacteria bacterium]|nr:M48 family metallopeptidase [Acidobacteriota bacterium]